MATKTVNYPENKAKKKAAANPDKPKVPRGIKKGETNPYSPVIGNNGINQKPGDNTRYCSLLLELMSWGPANKNNLEELEARLFKYIQFCMDNDMRITNQACYMAIGITRDDVYDWESGKSRSSDPRYSSFIKKVKQICATNRELLMSDGRLNPVTGIWWQKQYEGMKETSELVVTPNNPLGQEPDRNQLVADYMQAIPSDPPALPDAEKPKVIEIADYKTENV